MSWDNRVAWTEGLFLRPEHLQQTDRHVDRLARHALLGGRGFGWGFSALKLNAELLGQGRIGLAAAEGVLDDGTPFSLPGEADPPAPYAPPKHLRGERVHLCLPLRQPGLPEVQRHAATDLPARYRIAEQSLSDTVGAEAEATVIEVLRLRLRLLPESADRSGYACLPVARIVESRADGTLVLDEGHVPPALDCAVSPVLSGYLGEIAGLLHHRGEALAGRLAESGTRGVAEITDFMLLQAVNRFEPVFRHLAGLARLHPESAYRQMLQLAGELATFAPGARRCAEAAAYDHGELAATFRPVMDAIRSALNTVLEQSALPLPLRPFKYGVHLAETADRTLFASAAFVLAVRADIAADALRRSFPPQVKAGPAERIRELVNVALPGIGLEPLPVAPRQIPFAAGTVYFELDRSDALWKELQASGGLALHVSGDFPGLEMALWAIRGS
ncbi:type VI secretion system baseplate subunit TssK [Poseidonocella sp. HB161398]|uniref:type VI secretion system baseplate subunit TssK n=1 Tax=Poseidonocella sp. HB161398 TaxID=2320855 RepID=UPI00110A02C0|nr:type VI secretion system baseplate subunit TssK [Poseidonocella sp. HB161398]